MFVNAAHKQQQRGNKRAHLADLKGLVKLVPFLAAVTARVWTDSPLKCELTSRGAVISEVLD